MAEKKDDFEIKENGKRMFSVSNDYFFCNCKTKMKVLMYLLHFIIIELSSINISKE